MKLLESTPVKYVCCYTQDVNSNEVHSVSLETVIALVQASPVMM